ncbi:MAG: helix-turn-helix domain-containing protein [Acidimicrobiia bacterium]
MTRASSDTLLHPIRLRIVLSAANEEVTTADIAERLPDVPQASLYRHIARLVDAGMLEVSSERPIRGAIERTYRVNSSAVVMGPEDVSLMSNEQHLRAFTTFAAVLIESYGRYLGSPDANPSIDGVSFRQARLWLSEAELERMIADLGAALAPYLSLEPGPDRSPRTLSTMLMPEPPPPQG